MSEVATVTVTWDGENSNITADIPGDGLTPLQRHADAMMILADGLAEMAQHTPAIAGEGFGGATKQ